MELFDETQWATLRAAVDRIIPPDDELAGGLAAGVDAFLLRHLSPEGFFPEKRDIYRSGLDQIDALSHRMYSAGFAAIGVGAQDAVLIQLEAEAPAFFRLLVEQSQEGFYTSPAGYEMIGWTISG